LAGIKKYGKFNMGEIEQEKNWELFFDSYFNPFNPKVSKDEDEYCLTFNYEADDIYVYCELNSNRKKLNKLEFGRMVLDNRNKKESNWIKGVFKNDQPNNLNFLQTSWLGEDGVKYEAEFNEHNQKIISILLKTPCYLGWTEEEYWIKNSCYKILANGGGIQNSVTLMDIGEQDIPMLTDKFDQWFRLKIYDAFWNDKKRTIKKTVVQPMNKK